MRLPQLTPAKLRLGYLDWMRGLAAAIMLQGHVFEGWLRPADQTSEIFWFSQFIGGLPAPTFLFLVGVSLALVLDKLRARNASTQELLTKVLRRGGWILALAYAFRLEQFLVWYPASRWSDVFRVDTLNCIGACTLLIGFISIPFRQRRVNALVTGSVAALVVLLTPFLYVWRPAAPELFHEYFNGNGNPGYFSVIPWVAFALSGITFGFLLNDARESGRDDEFFNGVAVAGVCSFAIGTALNLSRIFEYGFFDYSLTSPHFFLVRLGYLLLILYGAYRWSKRATAFRWSPLRTLGQASLVVYWVHIEIVYGRLLHGFGFNDALTLQDVGWQLLWIVPSMILLASVWTNKSRLSLRTARLSAAD